MRALIQRVSTAAVTVDGDVVAEIGKGILVLLGVAVGDSLDDAKRLAVRTCAARIFPDESGNMNLNLDQVGGEALVVSQFTLLGDTSKGRRPSFVHAARPDDAEPLYEAYCSELATLGATVAKGVFGA
ncbi:MAG: D-tyrosyl-tRNA(Tyr) deacylase, partial [Acidobacteria bacterium]